MQQPVRASAARVAVVAATAAAVAVLLLANAPAKAASLKIACLVSINAATPADLAMEPALEAAGFGTIQVKEALMTVAMCESTCDAIVFSPADAFGGRNFYNCSKPMLSSEEGFWRESGMCAPGFFKGAGCCQPQAELVVDDETSPLAVGLSGKVKVFSETRDMSWALRSGLGADAKIAMSFASDTDHVTIFYYCKGGRMHGGMRAPGLRIAMPPHYGPKEPPLAWNDNGEAVLAAALSMLGQEADGMPVTGC